jgi:hypothetical protein
MAGSANEPPRTPGIAAKRPVERIAVKRKFAKQNSGNSNA